MARNTLIALILIIVILPVSSAHTATKWFINDTLSAASGGLTILNLEEGDIVCARFTPDPADFPLKILTLQMLVKGGAGANYIAKIFDGSAPHPEPGVELCSKRFLAIPDIFFNVDLSMEGAYIYSGDLVAGYQIDASDYAYPCTDSNPCTVGKNSAYFSALPTPLWQDSCPLYIQYDLVIRVQVDTNVPTPTPSPSPTRTPTPTITPTLSPTAISIIHTTGNLLLLIFMFSCISLVFIKICTS